MDNFKCDVMVNIVVMIEVWGFGGEIRVLKLGI